jgi:predicted transcriptional regulator
MSVKEQLLSSFKNLPEDASWEDAEERVRFLAAIDEARAQLDRGEGIPHEEVKRQVLSWFRK